VLLHAVVQLAFDAAAGGVSVEDELLPGLPEVLDLEEKLFERRSQLVDVRSLQRIDLLPG
jgi:hypothetical protein